MSSLPLLNSSSSSSYSSYRSSASKATKGPKKVTLTTLNCTFDTQKLLGLGTYAVVYAGEQNETKEPIAIKVVTFSSTEPDTKTLKPFYHYSDIKTRHPTNPDHLNTEISILAYINTVKERPPTIPELYSYGQVDHLVFLVMEQVHGESLYDYIKRNNGFFENDARPIFKQLCETVKFCHSHLIVHHDIKPENIMIDNNGKIKLLDFGLAMYNHPPGTTCTNYSGSPFYCCPAQLAHQPYDPYYADIWACGVTLYFMVQYCNPWGDEWIDFQKFCDNLIKGDFRFKNPSILSQSLIFLLIRILNHKAKKLFEHSCSLEIIMNHSWYTSD